jgi:hypothetical protein
MTPEPALLGSTRTAALVQGRADVDLDWVGAVPLSQWAVDSVHYGKLNVVIVSRQVVVTSRCYWKPDLTWGDGNDKIVISNLLSRFVFRAPAEYPRNARNIHDTFIERHLRSLRITLAVTFVADCARSPSA